MQIYILNRAKQTLATTASIYDDTHTMSLTAGSSSYEFTIDKADDASTSLETGNYVVLQDDNKKTWLFTILEVTEDQNTKTVYAEDAGIELINKAVDVWNFDEAHDFKYYFDLITKDTPWELGTNQLSGLSRTLNFEGRDTGLGRLLSVLKAFDNAECRFNVEFSLTEPVKFTVDVAKAIGNVRDDIQIVYNAELNNITKTESRAEFVTALCGVGGTLESEDGEQTTTVDFADLEYNQDGLYTSKGDKFLYAVDANKKFNPGDSGYIENFYEYDTQSANELLNRTITKLKTYSEPQLTYEADVKIIDGSLKIGDKVTIIDHDFNPAVYLTARVSTLVKSYTDSTKNTITFTNYELINSNVVLQNKVETIKNQITKLPTQQTVNDLKDKVINVSQQVDDAMSDVEDAKRNAQNAVDKAEQAIADAGLASDKADKVNEIAQSAQENAQNAINNAQSAIANAQNAISNAQKAQETANNAISNAQNAINQASSAGTVANAVKQDVINLKGGSTATVAELEDGLALKLERKDLNGYATESWTTTQISASADGLSAKIGKVSDNLNTQYTNLKASVDSVTTTVGEVKGDVTNLTGRIQSAETSINQTKSDVALKANKTDVDSLTNRVSSAESSIKVNSDGLALKANKTDVDNLTNRVSSAETSIKQNADSINITASKVDNLQVGGRNLLKNSKAERTGNAYNVNSYKLASLPEQNETVTVSFEILPGEDVKSYSIFIGDMYQGAVTIKNTGRQVFKYTFNVRWIGNAKPNDISDKQARLDIWRLPNDGTSTDSSTIYWTKLERGNKATDWTPAPEDTDSQISDLNTKYSNLNLTVNGIQSTVANKADQSTVTQLANTWQAKLDDVNKTTTASITAVRDDLTASINLKVSKNDVVNQINVDTSGVLIQGKKVHITGQTTIDNAVIKSAMIDTITADKIKTGTLNSLNINNGNGAFVVDSSGNVLISGGIITDNKVADERKLTIDLSNSKIRLSSGDNVYGLNLTTTGIYSLTNQTYMQMIDKSSLENAGFYFKTPYNFSIETTNNKYIFKENILNIKDTTRNFDGNIYTSSDGLVFSAPKTAIVSTTGGILLQAPGNVQVNQGGFIVKDAANIGALRVERDFSVGGSKNSSVKTSQGWTLINAYETAEYYFGDVGFAETGSGNKTKIVIDPIFLETVNTEDYQYHVFLSAYNNAKLWVSERQKDYFIVESDVPNVKFSYEIKAKRRGYENVRLAIDENMKGSTVDG